MTMISNQKETILTDLNCHILPGIDEGINTINDSISILEENKKQNIKQIIFTPHYYADKKDISSFLKERNKAASALIPYLQQEGFTCGLGAEVYMSKELLNLKLRPLAFSDTNYILLEWPQDEYCVYGEEIVNKCIQEGLTPIFSHIERYEFFTENLLKLEKFIKMGVVIQMDSSTVPNSRISRRLIQEGYVHILSNEGHLLEAYNSLDKDIQEQLIKNGNAVFNNEKVSKVVRSKRSPF